MKESEFRGKRIDNGEWVHGDFVHCCPGDCYIGKIGIVEGRNVQFNGEICAPDTVGQYTGRRATHDEQKIYRGDIIRYVTFNYDGSDNGVKNGYVEWSSEAAAYVIYPYFGAEEGDWLYIVLANDDDVEIIGNRWDNPELLEVSK